VIRLTFNHTTAAYDPPAMRQEASMTKEHQGQTAPLDVHLSIERDGDRYRIQSAKLQEIGEQLRGKRPFSVFNSLILPALVTLLTTLLTGTFQFVSWHNQVSVQAASDVAERAAGAYTKAADATGKRIQVTGSFIPVIRELGRSPAAEPPTSATDGRTSSGDETSKLTPLQSATALHQLDHKLSMARFDDYYDQLRSWDENYEKLSTDIGRHLDRPIFEHAGKRLVPVRHYAAKLKDVDCKQTLTQAIEGMGPAPGPGPEQKSSADSLRLQFAVLRQCFAFLQSRIDEQKVSSREGRVGFKDDAVDQINRELAQIQELNSEFACYARSRIGYYKHQKSVAIIGPRMFKQWLSGSQKKEAEDRFARARDRCFTENRPA
jgi:hypothetical protein